MFSSFYILAIKSSKFYQIFFFMGLMFLFVWIYIRFRKSQPQIYLRNLPKPVPPRNYATLPEDEQEDAKYFWEFLELFKDDFEKRGHPLQYRQLIDMLKYGPIQDMKDFGAETLEQSKHLTKYTKDQELRTEIFDAILENLKVEDLDDESVLKHDRLLLALPLTNDEIKKIISILEQDSKKIYSVLSNTIVKLKGKLIYQ